MIPFGQITHLGVTVPLMEGASEAEVEQLKRAIERRFFADLCAARDAEDARWVRGSGDPRDPPRGVVCATADEREIQAQRLAAMTRPLGPNDHRDFRSFLAATQPRTGDPMTTPNRPRPPYLATNADPLGADELIRESLGCKIGPIKTHEVTDRSGWVGFVHECEVLGHATVKRAFVLLQPIRDARAHGWLYTDTQGATDAKKAASMCLAEFAAKEAARAASESA